MDSQTLTAEPVEYELTEWSHRFLDLRMALGNPAKKKRLSREKFAYLIDLTAAGVWKIETGRTAEPNLSTRRAIQNLELNMEAKLKLLQAKKG